MLRLIELNLKMEKQFMEFRRALASEDAQDRWLFEYRGEPFDVLVEKLRDWKRGKQLPDGWVPASTFYMVRKNGKIVGKSSLRHELNDHLRKIGGHIGYYIRAGHRGKGYGTVILKLTLEKAKAIGLEKVLVTCDDDNIASAKSIEKNGGVLQDTYRNDDMLVAVRRYWITL